MTDTNACITVVDRYIKGLSDQFSATPTNRGCFVLTPFDRPDGEGIELEIENLSSGKIRISDMGDTLGYLYVNGLTLTRTVMDKARHISLSYGVSLESATLSIEEEPEYAGDALHNLIQATLAVTDLIQRRRPSNTRRIRFDNEVESFIIYSGVTYDADYSVRGAREKHVFRFHVDSGHSLLIQPISASTESAAHTWSERWEYRFLDTIESDNNWHPVAILDDRDTSVIWTPYALAPIEAHAILWSQQEELQNLFSGVRA